MSWRRKWSRVHHGYVSVPSVAERIRNVLGRLSRDKEITSMEVKAASRAVATKYSSNPDLSLAKAGLMLEYIDMIHCGMRRGRWADDYPVRWPESFAPEKPKQTNCDCCGGVKRLHEFILDPQIPSARKRQLFGVTNHGPLLLCWKCHGGHKKLAVELVQSKHATTKINQLKGWTDEERRRA